LNGKAARAAFVNQYRGLPSGDRLRSVLASLLADDPQTMAFFDALILLADEK
jgi:hypothetical protein